MYDFLEGQVASRKAANLTLLVSGVGYDVRIPLGVPMPQAGESGRIFVHFVVREDAQILFGFPDESLRDLFRLLLKVRGVGPNMALAVLSGLSRDDFLRAVLGDDVKRLQSIKGVGKKTAEQILLDLKDKAQSLAADGLGASASGSGEPAGPTAKSNIEDAVQALMSIGYPEKDATKRVEFAADKVDPDDLELLVRTAIQ
ncbi:MAG: Holliday junction branch migration protein RuvA, partial [Planctomycetes bacterium]|nr:Holliday junction branch migration protein RuvA [Planctomycetota bacterium]